MRPRRASSEHMRDHSTTKGRAVSFTQTIEVQTDDEAALRDHIAGWHVEQAGVAPGYRRGRGAAPHIPGAPPHRDFPLLGTSPGGAGPGGATKPRPGQEARP